MSERLPYRPLPLEAAELLAHAAWMRRLGAALAGGEGEDLAQETWLAALARPAQTVEQPRRWLATVMRNLARTRARGDGRRRRREEQRAARDESPSTHELVARAELEQRAVQAVLALEEPWREALLLRYVEGLEPAEIARQLSLPGSTVRSRIAHGLELVRARLDRQHGGERRVWAALLLPAARTIPSTPWMAAGAAGGLLMNFKWTFAAVALGLVALLVVVQREHASRKAEQAGRSAASAELTSVPTVESRPGTPALAAREPAPLALAGGAPPSGAGTQAALDVRVRWSDGVTPARDLPVELQRWNAGGARLERLQLSDAEGRARFSALPAGEYLVRVRSSLTEFVELEAGRTHTLELVFQPGVDVEVLVLDAREEPVAGATVWLSDYGNSAEGLEAGRTDARGRFWLGEVLPGQSVAAWAAGHAPSAQADVRGADGSELELVLRLRSGARALRGRVRAESGQGIAGATVLVGAPYPAMLELADGSQHTGPPPRRLQSAEDGSFALDGLAPGVHEVRAFAARFAPTRADVQGEFVELVLPREARVVGRVRRSDGQAAGGVEVSGSNEDFGSVTTRSAPDGSFTLGGLLGGLRELRASDEALGTLTESLVLVSGGETHWEPMLVAGTSVAGHVRDARGAPLVGWQVAAVELRHVGLWLREARSDAQGGFELVNCPETPFLLAVRAPEDPWGEPALLTDAFERGARDLELVVPDAARPSTGVVGRLCDADGRVPSGASVVLAPPRSGGVAVQVETDGSFRAGPTRPGEYALTVWTRDHAPFETEPFTLAAGQELDLGRLVLAAPAFLEVRVRGADGPLPPQAIAGLTLFRGGRFGGSVQIEDEFGRSGPLTPGTYVLSGHEDDWWTEDVTLELEPGATRTLELAFRPAGRQELEFVVPAGNLARRFELFVRDATGRLTHHHWTGFRADERYRASAAGLPPGEYSFEAATDTGLRATGRFQLAPGAPPGAPLVVELRD